MRKKINSVTITLYIIFFALAIICGVLEPILPLKMWIGVIVFLALMVLVALLRYFLLLNENKKAKKSGAVRVVDVQPSKVKGTVISSKAISEAVNFFLVTSNLPVNLTYLP